MATITSVADGEWTDGTTWDGGTVPTAEDDVYIDHTVDIAGNASAQSITVRNGSLVTDGNPLTSKCTLTFGTMLMERKLTDDRMVRLDGLTLSVGRPSISCKGTDSFPPTPDIIWTQELVIIDDPGVLGFSSQMQDIRPEGIARAWARKVSNGVRYMTLAVKIKADHGHIIGSLYRMAEGPFQVLAVTYSAVIKGHIESITPVDSVGKEYRTFRITVAEGQ